jgi:hypothetical protein
MFRRSDRTWTIAAAFGLGSFTAAGACSLRDLSDIHGTSPVDAAVVDAASEGPGSDGSLRFCASHTGHALCADFDLGPYNAQFGMFGTTPGGTLSATPPGISPPNSLLAQVGTSPMNRDGATLSTAFVGTASSSVTLSFQLLVDSWINNYVVDIALITINGGAPKGHELNFYAGASPGLLNERFGAPDGGIVSLGHSASAPTPLGTWVQVEITLDLANHTCIAKLDTAVVVSDTIDPSWTAGPPMVTFGIVWAQSQSSPWSVRYDNVLIDWQ